MLKIFSPDYYRSKPIQFILLFFVSLFGALLGGKYFFRADVMGGLSSAIIDIGLDPQRTQLVVALLLTVVAGVVGGLLGRRKSGTMVGAAIVFWFGYLAAFVQVEMQPLHDPGGHLEPLNASVLFHVGLVMMALALLCGFIGAAIGLAIAEAVLDPCYLLIRALWQRLARLRIAELNTVRMAAQVKTRELSRLQKATRTGAQWFGVGILIALIVLAGDAGNLFIFAPDIGVHTIPRIVNARGVVTARGVVKTDTLVSPALKGQHRSFLAYLPASYSTPQGATRRYPVLYLLHGVPGKDVDWIIGGKASESADSLIAAQQIHDLILILPDGNGRAGATSEWANSFDQRQLLETYVVKDLVAYVDQQYRTIPDAAHRAIGGLSMGGFGAVNIAEHHPDVFGTAISLGGYYYAEGAIWGKNVAYMQQNSPALTFPKNKAAWKLHLYLGAATKDQPYYSDTKQFIALLNKLHIPVRFDLQKGYHAWPIWQTQMYNALVWLQW